MKEVADFANGSADIVKKKPYFHAIILAANETGRINLYRLVSMGHLDYFYRKPRVPKSMFLKYRDGLIIGSPVKPENYIVLLLDEAPESRIKELVDFYDYLEIQPLGNNAFMVESDKVTSVNSMEDIMDLNRKIVHLGEQFHKPVRGNL